MGKNKDIRQAVEDELAFDPLVDDTYLRVINAGGVIGLHGSVSTYPQYLAAETAARRVGGVTQVHNHLDVELDPADYRDDALLTTAANNALTQAITVPPGVEATAKNGKVTLTGSVTSGLQKAAAAVVVAGLYGVRGIDNDIVVWSEADIVDVLTEVQAALDRHALVWDDSTVEVGVDDHTVTVGGHVRTWAEHDAVLDATWRADGVYDVQDELVVTG